MAGSLPLEREDQLASQEIVGAQDQRRSTYPTLLSRTTEYALRAIVWLSDHPESSVTGQAIAAATQVPPDYLAKVMQCLVRCGAGGSATRQERRVSALHRSLDNIGGQFESAYGTIRLAGLLRSPGVKPLCPVSVVSHA
jgi:hypothetical protein